MLNGPQVRTKRTPTNDALSGLLNANSQFWGGHPVAGKDPPEVLVAHIEPALEVSDGEGEGVPQVGHPLKGITYGIIVKPNASSNIQDWNHHNEGMTEAWPQKNRFRVLLALYQTRNGKSQDQVASELGVSLGHLRNLLYRSDKRPSLELLQRACTLFGVSVTDFIDDPNARPAGQDLSSASEQSRFLASVIVQDMNAPDLTDEDRQELWEDFQRGLSRIRKRKAQTK